MRIFALETDLEKQKKQFISVGEKEVLFTRYHGLSFLFSSLREIFITAAFIGVAIIGFVYSWPMLWVGIVLGIAWVTFVMFNLLKAYIDWCYDFILVTTDKVILMDQTSIFHHTCNPIHIENVGSVVAETQFWNIFPFGIVRINLKEGEGGKTTVLRYVPNAGDVAAKISDVVTYYQRFVDGGDRDIPHMKQEQAPAPSIDHAQDKQQSLPSQVMPQESELPLAQNVQ